MCLTGEKMNRKFGVRDWLFLVSLFIFGILLTIGIYCFSEQGSAVTITVDGQLYGTYPLNASMEIPVELDGKVANTIIIEDGKASMKEADCPDRLCVHQGAIMRNKQTIVCLPHKLVVEVVGGEKEEYDSISE